VQLHGVFWTTMGDTKKRAGKTVQVRLCDSWIRSGSGGGSFSKTATAIADSCS
jgi:hypothetical protein